MQTSAVGNEPHAAHAQRGFTLIELMVVIAIIAIATAGVSLALRDRGGDALEREATRLAALFESARAQARVTGAPVRWRPTAQGFAFSGLPATALPARWLSEGTVATIQPSAVSGAGAAEPSVTLGPEPMIGAQAVTLTSSSAPSVSRTIATDGLRPFEVVAAP